MLLNSIILASLLAASTLGVTVPSVQVKRQEAVKTTDLRGFDVSVAQAGSNPKFWTCAHAAGYTKAVIRGYTQSCNTVRLFC